MHFLHQNAYPYARYKHVYKSRLCTAPVFLVFSIVLSSCQVYLLRKQATHNIPKEGLRFYILSLSTETIVYKVSFAPEKRL